MLGAATAVTNASAVAVVAAATGAAAGALWPADNAQALSAASARALNELSRLAEMALTMFPGSNLMNSRFKMLSTVVSESSRHSSRVYSARHLLPISLTANNASSFCLSFGSYVLQSIAPISA